MRGLKSVFMHMFLLLAISSNYYTKIHKTEISQIWDFYSYPLRIWCFKNIWLMIGRYDNHFCRSTPGCNWLDEETKHPYRHLDRLLGFKKINSGDTVIGILPMHLAAEVCSKGARFFALSINLRRQKRGKELMVEELENLTCSLKPFYVEALSPNLRF